MAERPGIHIVGLYKCGTSWLLRMLAAHPEVIAWREFDPVLAAFAPDYRWRRLPALAADYLRRRPESDSWRFRRERDVMRSADAVFEEYFLGRGWVPLMGAEQQQAALALRDQASEELVDGLLSLGELRLRPDEAEKLSPIHENGIHGIQGFNRATLVALVDAARSGRDTSELPGQFYTSLRQLADPDTVTVCKAADQIMRLNRLRSADPGARHIAIIRDGRDAMISAQHYEKLMRKRGAPWQVNPTSGLRRLIGWSVRAAKLADHARRGEVLVVRYEDLLENFAQTTAHILQALELECTDDIVGEMTRLSSFESMSQGRARGQSAENVVRRGVSGEWREALTPRMSKLAWKLVGKELQAFGYAQDGTIDESSLLLHHR
ncbi:MAG: hypothetical protein Cons2KO_18550 [Congregibacter sp.]